MKALSARAALGASLVAFFVLLALGAVPASAVSLCKAAENPECLPAKTYAIWTNFELKGSNAVFGVTGVTEVKCSKTSAQLTLTEEGTPLLSQITNMVFSGCEDSESNPCVVETRNQPLLSDIYKYSETSYVGLVLLVPREGANPSWKLECTGGITCIYGHKEFVEGFLKPGAAPALEIWRRPLERELGSCPATADIRVIYSIETSPIYVTLE